MTSLNTQPISQDVLAEKYLAAGEHTAEDLFRRVSQALADQEKPELRAEWAEKFFKNMQAGAIGAGRIMAAAGLDTKATLINCFVQPVADATNGFDENGNPGIYTALSQAAETMRRGGGVGYDFSNLRPKGARVKGTNSYASGPCSFIDVFDASCTTVESAGARRGAQMGVMRIDHPDVLDFITAKRQKGRWNNFNVSVGVTSDFMQAVENDAHTPIVDMLAKAIQDWLENDSARAKGWIDKQLPKWLPGLGKDKAGEWLYERLIELSKEVQEDYDHPIRHSIERLLHRFADQLQSDPVIIERVNAAKMRLVDRPEVRHTISDIWISTKKTLRQEAANPNSELRTRVTTLIANFGTKVSADRQLQETIDTALENATTHLVDRYRDEIAAVISDTVARWDAGDTTKKIELQVGRDLQFIRVNGPIVGALAGIAIHAIGEMVVR
jgi:hypothetical protein